MRAVIYARYSSDLQREASIADQVEVCRRYLESQGWRHVQTYTDAALSGASRHRPGFQALRAAAIRREFDIVVCEAVDRLGRRLADTADLQDTFAFHGIRLVTPALGEITTIHVAVMGMMAQMALKDLGEKTKRGQLGRVLQGRIPSGLAFGYKAVQDTKTGGERRIDPNEAAVVRRIFRDYAAGKTPEQIAKELNRDGVPGPGGRPWSNTTLRGQASRGTGILNNALYVGRIAWNRCSYVKDPETGKRVARPNPPETWEVVEAPDLAIIDQELWDRVKARQGAVQVSTLPDSDGRSRLNRARGARFLLSGKLHCDCCGEPYAVIGKDRFGCAKRHRQGTCTNAVTIRRDEIEARVLSGLKERLLAPDLLAIFVEEVRSTIEAARTSARDRTRNRDRSLAEIRRKIAGLLAAIEDGLYDPSFKQRLADLRAEEAEVLRGETDDDGASLLPLLTHPRLAEAYRRKVELLEAALDGDAGFEARELLRSMIARVDLSPRSGGGLDEVLTGELATILALSAEAGSTKAERPEALASGRQIELVAGARFELTTFRL